MKKTISVRLSVALHKRLQQISRQAGISMSSLAEQRLLHAEDEAQIRVAIERLDLLLEHINQLKSDSLHTVVLEFLKEISIRVDSRIPSIVKARLAKKVAAHE